MKIFNWVQNKLQGRKQGSKKQSGVSANHQNFQEPYKPKEEFSDWPHGLLAIGTFGNNDLKQEPEMCDPPEDPSSSQDLLGFTPEEVGKLEKELTKLLSRNPVPTGAESTEGEATHLPLDKFLNCPSSLEVDRTICQRFCHDLDDRDDDHPGCSSSVVSKGKDVNLEGNTAIRRRSISFLLKKIFVCRSGFTPIPSLRDQLQESKMEKLLKDMLHKRIYPRSSSTSSTKKYLENRQMLKTGNEDDGCKWVKTDSEYIVLEM